MTKENKNFNGVGMTNQSYCETESFCLFYGIGYGDDLIYLNNQYVDYNEFTSKDFTIQFAKD